MANAVETVGLTKHYKNAEALTYLDLEVREGEIFGLIGPNGAGKSTALKILATLLTPTSGKASVFGIDVVERPEDVRRIIGYLPEEAGAYKQLTGREYLRFMADFFESDKDSSESITRRGIEIAGLGERIDDKTKEYSKGMKRRLLIARTLMIKPGLAILDEPASGLDVKHAYYVRGIIKDYVKEHGVSVLLSSHNMLEVEFLCDRVALIDEGKTIDTGTPDELKAKYGARNLEEVFIDLTERRRLSAAWTGDRAAPASRGPDGGEITG